MSRLPVAVHPMDADAAGRAVNRLSPGLLGHLKEAVVLGRRRGAQIAAEESKDNTQEEVCSLTDKVEIVWRAFRAYRLPSQENLGRLIWRHKAFIVLAVLLHLGNVVYISIGSHTIFLNRKTWADACEPEVFPLYYYDVQESKWTELYTSVNAFKVLILILVSKLLYYGALVVLRCRTCPLRLHLNWSEAGRVCLFIDWFNPVLFTGLAAWYIMTRRSDECRAHYTMPMYDEIKRLVDAQLFYQLPFVLYLYGGVVLCTLKTWVVGMVEWMLDGCPDAVTPDTVYLTAEP